MRFTLTIVATLSSLALATETLPFPGHKDACHILDQAACNSSTECTWCTSNLGSPTLCYGTSCHKLGHCYYNEAAEHLSAKYFTCESHDAGPTPEPEPAPEPVPPVDKDDDQGSATEDVCDQHNQDSDSCMENSMCTWCKITGLVPDEPQCVLLTDAPWVPKKFFECEDKIFPWDPKISYGINRVSTGINCAKFQNNDDCNSDSECSWCVKSSPLGKKKMCVKGGEALSTYIPLGFKCNNLD